MKTHSFIFKKEFSISVVRLKRLKEVYMSAKNETLSNIWKLTKEILEKQINDRTVFKSLIVPSNLVSLQDHKAIVVTDSELSKNLVSSGYAEKIKNAINKVTESQYDLTFLSNNEWKKKSEINESKHKKTFFEGSSVKSKYRFDNFVMGDSNKNALRAAQFVSSNPGQYNPLFIYADSGLGKTHLLHAIGNKVKELDPSKKVLYITSDEFIDEFINYVRAENDRESLKSFFKTVDYLLIDDIQFLARKSATEIMFFNIFNILVEKGKQIVITSDCQPKDLEGLDDRLVTRFSQGLSISIEKPEKNTLIKILKLKIKANGSDESLFDDEALDYIASHNASNIRELEGALNRILFFNVTSSNTGRISLDIVKQAFNRQEDNSSQNEVATPKKVVRKVANYYNLTDTQILSKVRTQQIALARAIAMYLCRSVLAMSYIDIASFFKKKDHTTIMSACEKVDNLLKSDDAMKKAIKTLTNQIK